MKSLFSPCGACAIGQFAASNAVPPDPPQQGRIPIYRITLNDRLDEKERFVTLCHELGHIFCGHLGPCLSAFEREDGETGWPDRRTLGKKEREIEAEAVAYLIAARAGLVTASAAYLHDYAEKADMSQVKTELVVRAASRIERLGKVHYGMMTFKASERTSGAV